MAVKQAYAMLNGQKVIATLNEETGLYTVEITAPAESSWSQTDHVYNVSLHAEDLASNTVEMTSADPTYGSQLKIRVLEKTKPVATILSPTQNSVLGSSTQNIVMEVVDNGGSGLNMESIVFKLNGTAITEGLTWTDGENGKKTATYVASGLSDGANKAELQVSDNDGNASDVATTDFIISTVAPTLSVDTPADNLITNQPTVTVSGHAAPGSDVVTLSEITVNGSSILFNKDDGSYSHDVTISEGTNSITVTAKDSVGKTTSVTRTVILDTKAPVISDVVAEATTVDASGIIRITFRVVDPE